jgi:hypothetical protein
MKVINKQNFAVVLEKSSCEFHMFLLMLMIPALVIHRQCSGSALVSMQIRIQVQRFDDIKFFQIFVEIISYIFYFKNSYIFTYKLQEIMPTKENGNSGTS